VKKKYEMMAMKIKREVPNSLPKGILLNQALSELKDEVM